MVGLETALPVVSEVMVTSGAMTWSDVARVMSQAPARIAGLTSHGGSLGVGQPAHLTLVDPAAVQVVDRDRSASLSRNNPWHDRKLTGAVVATFHGGNATVLDGALAGERG